MGSRKHCSGCGCCRRSTADAVAAVGGQRMRPLRPLQWHADATDGRRGGGGGDGPRWSTARALSRAIDDCWPLPPVRPVDGGAWCDQHN